MSSMQGLSDGRVKSGVKFYLYVEPILLSFDSPASSLPNAENRVSVRPILTELWAPKVPQDGGHHRREDPNFCSRRPNLPVLGFVGCGLRSPTVFFLFYFD